MEPSGDVLDQQTENCRPYREWVLLQDDRGLLRVSSQRASTVRFLNGRTARLLKASEGPSPRQLLDNLHIEPPGALILLVGAADSLDPKVIPWLTQLFSRGLAPAVRKTDALLLDGGTDSGAMAVLGQAVGDRLPRLRLVGVVPAAKVSYPGGPPPAEDRAALEPNHTQFVLADVDEWGEETELFFSLADELADRTPAVALLVGGGHVARAEVTQVVRRGWPLFVVAGTGGLADDIADPVTARESGRSTPVEDPATAEIVADGDIHLVSLKGEPRALTVSLLRRLRLDQSLELAWEQFAVLDDSAICEQKDFRRTQATILTLGVVATLLAVVQATLETEGVLDNHWTRDLLRYVIIIVPITLSALLAAAARFRAGTKWVMLRGGAEAVKHEIFRYRSRVGVYSDEAHATTPRPVRLAERVGTISGSVMKTDVNLAALRSYTGPLPPPGSVAERDDGFTVLTPEQYLGVRLRHQARWYQGKVVVLERKLRRLRWAVIGFGGVGTFLAAVGLELWIAVTTAVVGAISTHLEYMQVESTLLHYNQAAADLETMRRWWTSLPPDAKGQQANVSRLVEQAERIMQSESAGWVQEMHDAMAELRRQQEDMEAKDTHGENAS